MTTPKQIDDAAMRIAGAPIQSAAMDAIERLIRSGYDRDQSRGAVGVCLVHAASIVFESPDTEMSKLRTASIQLAHEVAVLRRDLDAATNLLSPEAREELRLRG